MENKGHGQPVRLMPKTSKVWLFVLPKNFSVNNIWIFANISFVSLVAYCTEKVVAVVLLFGCGYTHQYHLQRPYFNTFYPVVMVG